MINNYEFFLESLKDDKITLSKNELYEFMNDVALIGIDKSDLWKERSKEIFAFITDYKIK